MTNAQAAALYYARKRRRARSEVTCDGGGMRRLPETAGFSIRVVLTIS